MENIRKYLIGDWVAKYFLIITRTTKSKNDYYLSKKSKESKI